MKPPPKKAPTAAGPGAASPPARPAAAPATAQAGSPQRPPAAATQPRQPVQAKGPPASQARQQPFGRPAAAGKAQPLGSRPGAAAAKPQKAQPAAERTAEDAALAIPAVSAARESPLFHAFIEKLAPRLSVPATSRSILQAFSNIDVTAEKLSLCIRENPYYEAQFLRLIQSLGKREDAPKPEAAIILLGMQNSRNLIVALQLLRTARGGHAEWSKEGKLSFAPADFLKFAFRTEEALAGDRAGYADTAYAAGLVYDYLALAAQEAGADPKKIGPFIEAQYAAGLKAAELAKELAKPLAEFTFKKHLFSACLVGGVGRIAMAILDPSYPDFLEACSKRALPRVLRSFAEEQRFGLAHPALGYMVCHQFRIFRPIERAVLCQDAPYVLRASNRNLHQLSCLIALSSNMASSFKRLENAEDPVIREWKGPELRDLKVDAKGIVAATQRVAR